LLDASGYPRGADGYRLKVKIGHDNRVDPTYADIVMGYFEAIGVESELIILSSPEGAAAQAADEIEYGLIFSSYGPPSGFIWTFLTVVAQNFDGMSHNKAKDPRMDALYLAAKEALDIEEYKSILRQADEITVREHWGLVKSSSARFAATHPWVQGYFGEEALGLGERNAHLARIWIDSELKKALGR
jgi:ABC-type transport system substrate-binding protein